MIFFASWPLGVQVTAYLSPIFILGIYLIQSRIPDRPTSRESYLAEQIEIAKNEKEEALARVATVNSENLELRRQAIEFEYLSLIHI